MIDLDIKAFRNDMEQLVGANNVHGLGPTRQRLAPAEPASEPVELWAQPEAVNHEFDDEMILESQD